MKHQTLQCLGLFVLGALAYAPALPTGFLYDDHLLIEANSAIRSVSLASIKHSFASSMFQHPESGVDFYRPLQTLSTQVEYALWKLHPFPYHLDNLLLHLGNALLLYTLLMALGVSARTAFLTGSLFVVHPTIVEDLLMVSGRGELLGLFFMLSCILFFLQPNGTGVLLGLGCYLLAALSKESALLTPVFLALVLYYKREKISEYQRLLPMAAIAALYLLLRHHVFKNPLGAITLYHPVRFYVVAFPWVLLRYARILLFPDDLHTDRLLTPMGPHPFLAFGIVTVGLVWLFCRGPRWGRFCAAWYILSFLPKTPLMMSGSFMSDHWAYPALPALALPLAIGLTRLEDASKDVLRYASRGAALCLIFVEILVVHANIYARNTDEKLYRSALRYTSSPVMQFNLGIVLLRQGRPAEALPYFENLQKENSSDTSMNNLVTATRAQSKAPILRR